MNEPDRFAHERWESILDGIDLELVQMAVVCHVRLLDPGVVERVLAGEAAVCGRNNAAAFRKLRALLVMHFTAREQIAHELGPEQAEAIADHVREHLRVRIGDQLGGTRPGAWLDPV